MPPELACLSCRDLHCGLWHLERRQLWPRPSTASTKFWHGMIGWGTDGLMHTPSAKEVGRNTLVPFSRPCHEDGGGAAGRTVRCRPPQSSPLSLRHAEANGSAH